MPAPLSLRIKKRYLAKRAGGLCGGGRNSRSCTALPWSGAVPGRQPVAPCRRASRWRNRSDLLLVAHRHPGCAAGDHWRGGCWRRALDASRSRQSIACREQFVKTIQPAPLKNRCTALLFCSSNAAGPSNLHAQSCHATPDPSQAFAGRNSRCSTGISATRRHPRQRLHAQPGNCYKHQRHAQQHIVQCKHHAFQCRASKKPQHDRSNRPLLHGYH